MTVFALCVLWCRQRNGRLHCRLSGEYTGSACLPECEAWLHAQFDARIGTNWGRRLVENIRRCGTCHHARYHALAKSTHACIFSSAEFRTFVAWWYAGRCDQLFGIHMGMFAMALRPMLVLFYWRKFCVAGIVTGVHWIGDDYVELAGQNDWFARRFSAYGRQWSRWWRYPNHG